MINCCSASSLLAMQLPAKAFGFTMQSFYEAELIVTDESAALAEQ